jgi:hypothetical protein
MKKVLLNVLCLLLLTLTPIYAQRAPVKRDSQPIDGHVSVTGTSLGRYEGIITIPAIYQQWWKEAMECTGLKIPMSQTTGVWFSYVNGRSFSFPDDTLYYIGYTFAKSRHIMLVLSGVYDAHLVKHEMTHYLMYQSGMPAGGHPPQYFDKCGYR